MAEKHSNTCRSDGCISPVLCKGLCSLHYQRLRLTGSLEGSAKPRRFIVKPCQGCGTEMSLSLSKKDQQYCSRSCASSSRHTHPLWKRLCSHCHREIPGRIDYRHPRNYCDRVCYQASRSLVAAEKESLHLIGHKVRRPRMQRESETNSEIRALRRIASNVKARTSTCRWCSEGFLRKRSYERYCSAACRDAVMVASKATQRAYARKYRQENPERRRADKAARKARIRGAGEVHNIDPIKVFERDGWRCHICGVNTPKRYRGTHKDCAPELEHIISIADGGSHTWGNVACSCRRCNGSKGASSYGQLGFDIAL